MKKIKAIVMQSLYALGYTPTRGLNYKQWSNKYLYLYDLFKKIEHVDGNIVECGVAYGESLMALAIYAKREGRNRKVYGLDSFMGFPEPMEIDDSPRNPQAGEFKDAKMYRVQTLADKVGVEVELIKGFLSDTVHEVANQKIAFLHIDVDLYEGYRDALTLYPYVQKGGIIAFDEYGTTNWPGATKAVDDWLASVNEKLNYDEISGKYYIVKR